MEISGKTLRVVGHIKERGEGYLNQVARETGISKPTVLKIFGKLVSAGVLTHRRVGGAKLYTLDMQNRKTRGICMLLEEGPIVEKGKESSIHSAVREYLKRKALKPYV